MKKIWSLLMVACLLPIVMELTGCKKSTASPKPLAVVGISPQQGITGSTISIRGTSFGTDAALIKVTINGKDAVIEAVNDTEIKARIPFKAGSGLVKVVVGGVEAAGPKFTYIISTKDLEGTVWTGESKYGTSPTLQYVLEVNADGKVVWHDEAQDLNNGTWKMENGQLYLSFISTRATVKADITEDFKLKNIQNNIYNATNDEARQWQLLNGELDTMTEMELNHTIWKDVDPTDKNALTLKFQPDNVIEIYRNDNNLTTTLYKRKAGCLRFGIKWGTGLPDLVFAIIKPDGRITFNYGAGDRYYVKIQ